MAQFGHKSVLKILILILMLLGFSASAGTAFLHVNRWLETSAKSQHLTYARVVTSTFNQWLTTNGKLLRAFADAIATNYHASIGNERFSFLIDQYTNAEKFEYVSYSLEENGYYHVNNWTPPEGYDPRTRPWYQVARSSAQPVTYRFFKSIDNNAMFFSLSAAIRHQEKFLGVVSGETSVDSLEKLLLQTASETVDYTILLVNESGKVVFNSRHQVPGLTHDVLALFNAQLLGELRLSLQVGLPNELLATYQPVTQLGLGLIVVGSTAKVNQNLLEESASLLLHFVIIFICVMLAFYVSSRKILVPMLDILELDGKTALPNKAKFKSLVTQTYIDCNIPGTLLIINLDSFNQLTAAYSQSVITRLITLVKGRIQAKLPANSLLGVFSESRFVAFVPNGNNSRLKSESILSDIKIQLERPFLLPEQEINLSITIGASDFPQHGQDIEVLIDNAFTAYSNAKSTSNVSFCLFSHKMKQEMGRQQLIVSALKNGLRQGELFMVYQPQYDAHDHQIVGMEALIRWQSAELGRLVSPMEFIDIVEQSDLVVKLGNYVINQVCQQLRTWLDNDILPPIVAINISPTHLLHKSFVHDLFVVLTKYQILPEQIELELTETSFITNPELAIAIMHELKQLGVKLAIDDFGCGYSSFQYLKSMPLDKLKIDRSFVKELSHSMDDKIIIQSIASIAEHMHITLLAEGVETPEQLAILKSQAVDQIQGYLFSKPLAVDEISTLLSQDAL